MSDSIARLKRLKPAVQRNGRAAGVSDDGLTEAMRAIDRGVSINHVAAAFKKGKTFAQELSRYHRSWRLAKALFSARRA